MRVRAHLDVALELAIVVRDAKERRGLAVIVNKVRLVRVEPPNDRAVREAFESARAVVALVVDRAPHAFEQELRAFRAPAFVVVAGGVRTGARTRRWRS